MYDSTCDRRLVRDLSEITINIFKTVVSRMKVGMQIKWG
jgi:hypothetical protein